MTIAPGQPSEPAGPELIIGLVTPIGTNTGALAESLIGTFSDYGYDAVVIKLSEHLPGEPPPLGEREDHRVRRLIAAGNAFCVEHASAEQPDGDPAALARLAIREIRKTRLALLRQDGETASVDKLIRGRRRTAYILHSLKRPAEVQLLRRVYGEQFILIGSHGTPSQPIQNLVSRPMTTTEVVGKRNLVDELIRLDAEDHEKNRPASQRNLPAECLPPRWRVRSPTPLPCRTLDA